MARKRTSRRNNTPRIRVRAKRLEQLDESKLALALWLLAKQAIEDQTQRRLPDSQAHNDELLEAPDDEGSP